MVASQIGLEVGDEITKINNTSIVTKSAHDVGAHLKQKTFLLTFKSTTNIEQLEALICDLQSTQVQSLTF